MAEDEFKQTDAYKQTTEYKLNELGNAWDKLIKESKTASKFIGKKS